MKVPFPLSATVPPRAERPSTPLTLRLSPSGSVSLASTLPVVTGVSSSVVTLSSAAEGGLLTGSTVILTVPCASPPLPSLTV